MRSSRFLVAPQLSHCLLSYLRCGRRQVLGCREGAKLNDLRPCEPVQLPSIAVCRLLCRARAYLGSVAGRCCLRLDRGSIILLYGAKRSNSQSLCRGLSEAALRSAFRPCSCRLERRLSACGTIAGSSARDPPPVPDLHSLHVDAAARYVVT
jgi:hypothetical protein